MENEKLNKILIAIIIFLTTIIFIGTIIGIPNKKKEKTPEVLISKGKAENLAKPVDTSVVAYYNLEKIRIVTAPIPEKSAKKNTNANFGTPMVLNPWLAYPEGDTVFYEEIARKRGVLKAIFSSYFTNHTKAELLSKTEQAIVQELIAQINENLSLGQILDIYFTDYLFLE